MVALPRRQEPSEQQRLSLGSLRLTKIQHETADGEEQGEEERREERGGKSETGKRDKDDKDDRQEGRKE